MRLPRILEAALGAPLGMLLAVGLIAPSLLLFVYSFFGFELFEVRPELTLAWYARIFSNKIYLAVTFNTLAIALPTTALSVVGGYLIAYYIVFVAGRDKSIVLALVVVSLLSSYLARIYAWRTLMGDQGIVNTVLQASGMTQEPIGWLLFSRAATIMAEVNLYMPLTALICYASLSSVPGELREAARDLGAGRVQMLRRVILPLTGPALFGSAALTFFLSSGDYITPVLLGGPTSSVTFGSMIAAQLSTTGNIPLVAALSACMVALFIAASLLLFGAFKGLGFLPARQGA